MSREEHLSSDFFVLWAGAVLIMLPTPFRSALLVDGWAALLAYPKLYGGLMLWALCLRKAQNDSVPISDKISPVLAGVPAGNRAA
jgi:hypothetical protein